MKFAVVDLDETLIDGSMGYYITKHLLKPGKNKPKIPRKYYIKMLKYFHIPLLTALKRFYRIYRYIIHKSYQLYLRLLKDPNLPRGPILREMIRAAEEVNIPKESITFIHLLKEKGYTVVLLTATPQEIAEVVGRRLGVDMVIGSREGEVMDRENKERVLKELSKRGSIDIIVGNPKNEPFHLAKKLVIMVKSPRELKRWFNVIESLD